MQRLNPKKLSIEFRYGTTPTSPEIPRFYTLTHSDITGDLFLTIATEYAYDKVSSMHDEVFGEWILVANRLMLYITIHVDIDLNLVNSQMRNKIFTQELPLALEAFRYGDKKFFKAHSQLNEAPIYIHFDSIFPELNRIECYGTPSDYV